MRFLLLLLSAFCFAASKGATITAASTGYSDVSNAVFASASGDTVIMPSGASVWTNTMVVTKAITLMGSGTNSTIITNSAPDANADNLADYAILQISLVSNRFTRLSHIQFTQGTADVNYNGIITVSGTGGTNAFVPTFRADNLFLNQLFGASIFTVNVVGVIDHCAWYLNSGNIGVYVYHSAWNGVANSDGSFTDAANWGSRSFLFVEDCIGVNSTGYAFTDAYRGARYVVRNCQFDKMWLEMHGTDSGGRLRGTRAVECYRNTFTNAPSGFIVNVRSGSLLCWSNTVSSAFTPIVRMDAYRRFFHFSPWGQADGTNAWDVNAPGGPFETGIATSGGSVSLTDSGKSWTVNQWAGYSLTKSNAGSYHASHITANTATTITVAGAGGFGTDISFTAGDGYSIYRVTEAFDQPGRSGGTQLSGDPPTVIPNDQIDDPCYIWGNSASLTVSPAAEFIRVNEHYFLSALGGYMPYTYPHPLTSGVTPAITLGSGVTLGTGVTVR